MAAKSWKIATPSSGRLPRYQGKLWYELRLSWWRVFCTCSLGIIPKSWKTMKDFLYSGKRKWISILLAILGLAIGFILMILGGVVHFVLGLPGAAVMIASVLVLSNAKIAFSTKEGIKEVSAGQIIGGSCLVVVIVLVGISIVKSSTGDNAVNLPTDNPTPSVVAQPDVTSKDITVLSQAVKEVDGKYRYFFVIKNEGTTAFSGEVNIDLINAKGESVYNNTFTTSQAMTPGGITSQYIDAHTGPTSVHGEYGVQTFKYTVKSSGKVIKSGQGTTINQLGGY